MKDRVRLNVGRGAWHLWTHGSGRHESLIIPAPSEVPLPHQKPISKAHKSASGLIARQRRSQRLRVSILGHWEDLETL